MKILFIFISFELSKREKELDRDSKKIKRMKRAWSLIFVWLWEIWNKEALFGKRRAESSSNRHWLPTFWSCCFIKFILVSMLNCCSFFFAAIFNIFMLRNHLSAATHCVCMSYSLPLSQWLIHCNCCCCCWLSAGAYSSCYYFPFPPHCFGFDFECGWKVPQKKNTIANVMRSNLLRRNCFSNKIPYRNNFWNSLCVLSPCVCPKTKRYYN